MNDPSRLDGVRVLIVDDTHSVLDVVTAMLACNGAAVTAVASAEEALDVLQRDVIAILALKEQPSGRLVDGN